MTQQEFNNMLSVAVAQGIVGGTYISRYDGEEIDALLGGKSLVISGVYPSLAALQAAFPNGASGAYQISSTKDLYVWNNTTRAWENLGPMQGPKGENGATYTPVVSPVGILSWVNDKNLSNPNPVNVNGPVGPQGKQGPEGPPGPKGNPGSSIQSIERTAGNGAPGSTDTYTVALTDGGEYTFQVYNGKDGFGAGDMTKSVYDPQNKQQDIFSYVDDRSHNNNLIINWYFQRPVNRNGKMGYTGVGYTIDRWQLLAPSAAVTLTESGIKITDNTTTNNTVVIQQLLENAVEHPVTVSVLVKEVEGPDNVWYISDGVENYPLKAGLNYMTFGKLSKVYIWKFAVPTSITIQAIKAELGSVQTLARQNSSGEWEIIDPPNYDLQYALCSLYSPITGEWIGSQHSNKNLLDNWYWANRDAIINQRGQEEYNSSGNQWNYIYTIDRWKTDGNISLSPSGINIFAPHGYDTLFCQFMDSETFENGETYTFSVLLSNGMIITETGVMDFSVGDNATIFGDLDTIRLALGSNQAFVAAIILVKSSQSLQLKAAKLELGPVQTLAHQDASGNWVLNDPPPNRTLELLKCMRYYQKISVRKTSVISPGGGPSRMFVDLRPRMRVNPAATITNTLTTNVSIGYSSTTDSIQFWSETGEYFDIYEIVADANL